LAVDKVIATINRLTFWPTLFVLEAVVAIGSIFVTVKLSGLLFWITL